MSGQSIWTVIVFLGIGTFLIRFSFLGIIGKRQLPYWLLRYLSFVPFAVLPGMIAPMVVWPQATGGEPEPARLIAAAIAVLVGVLLRSALGTMFSGMSALYLIQYLLNG